MCLGVYVRQSPMTQRTRTGAEADVIANRNLPSRDREHATQEGLRTKILVHINKGVCDEKPSHVNT